MLTFLMAFLLVFQMAQSGWILCLKKNKMSLKTNSSCCCNSEEEQDQTLLEERVEAKNHPASCSCCVRIPFIAEPSKIQGPHRDLQSPNSLHREVFFWGAPVLSPVQVKRPPSPILPLLHTLLSTVILLI